MPHVRSRPIRRRTLAVALTAALCLLAACRAHQASDAPLAELTGLYTPGFETSRFVPCDARPGDRPWWVILSPDALRQRDSLLARVPADAGRTAYVRWRAVVGPEAPTGHLGASARWVHVAEIVELRATEDPAAAACDAADGVWRGQPGSAPGADRGSR